ncbi:MAG: hypothetical protein IJ565_00015 [Bacilli bacterium]|nr:hypothetical protein [Bacilli bacterium]
MKKKILSLVLCGIIILGITGCGSKNEFVLSNNLKDDETGITITPNEYIDDDVKVVVEDKTNDVTMVDGVLHYVAYDISLAKYDGDIKLDKKIDISKEVEVSIKIPSNFNKDNDLVIYYMKDDKIEETYEVEVDGELAKFKTTHFSIYVLAEIEKAKEEKTVENTKEETKTVESTTQAQPTTPSQTQPATTTKETKEDVASPSCTPKKFENKYTYVYDTEYECEHQGNQDYFYVDDNKLVEDLMWYNCKKIVDDCGDTYWGMYFRVWVKPDYNEIIDYYY